MKELSLTGKAKNSNISIVTILTYGAILGIGAFALHWMQYLHFVQLFPTQFYILIIAIAFTILGVWAGKQLTPTQKPTPFVKNEAALRSIGLTRQEFVMLEFLAQGHSNKQIARELNLSPNTIKTHVANLFSKLDASRRTQAIQKARLLSIIP